MKATKRVALAGVASALGTTFLVMSVYVPILDMSCMILASLCMLLPIIKNDYVGAGLCYLSTALLAFLLTGNIFGILPFAIFFGIHPIIVSLLIKLRVPIPIALIVKLIFANIAIFLAWKFLGLAINWKDIPIPYYVLAIGGSVVFLIYDWFIIRMKEFLNYYLSRIDRGKKRGNKR